VIIVALVAYVTVVERRTESPRSADYTQADA
jgi:hypothetical protein